MKHGVFACALLGAALATTAIAEEVNLYSSRHYETDERLYSDFEELTGITVNRIEGNGDDLIARLKIEGKNSPADVLITVDTSRLERAKAAGVLQSIESDVLEARIGLPMQDAGRLAIGTMVTLDIGGTPVEATLRARHPQLDEATRTQLHIFRLEDAPKSIVRGQIVRVTLPDAS